MPDEHSQAGWLSQVTALVLLTYAVARWMPLQGPALTVRLGGLAWNVTPTSTNVAALIAALMAANGAVALARQHPAQPGRLTRLEHALLPALTTWLLGVPLARLPVGGAWAVALLIGGGMLALVIRAELVVLDPENPAYAVAVPALTALAFGLLLMLTVTLRSTQARLAFQLLGIGLVLGVIGLRTLHLTLRRWEIRATAGLVLIGGHWLVALYYLPLTAMQGGLWLLALLYPLTLLTSSLLRGQPLRRALWEPLGMLLVLGWLAQRLG